MSILCPFWARHFGLWPEASRGSLGPDLLSEALTQILIRNGSIWACSQACGTWEEAGGESDYCEVDLVMLVDTKVLLV